MAIVAIVKAREDVNSEDHCGNGNVEGKIIHSHSEPLLQWLKVTDIASVAVVEGKKRHSQRDQC